MLITAFDRRLLARQGSVKYAARRPPGGPSRAIRRPKTSTALVIQTVVSVDFSKTFLNFFTLTRFVHTRTSHNDSMLYSSSRQSRRNRSTESVRSHFSSWPRNAFNFRFFFVLRYRTTYGIDFNRLGSTLESFVIFSGIMLHMCLNV